MKTTLFSFLLTFIFASCNSPKSYNSQPLSDRIIGDWIKEKPDTTFNKSILLSFEKSICFDFSNEFVNYKLVGNHLYIDELRKNTFRYLFRIENNKADELSLISINSHAKELSSILNHSDTLIFSRIPPAEYHPFFSTK
ncbi:hypothetical protein BWI96_05425 [Siphonobacter sp. SORGH_AS_0500]|uniref:hypothetical protein n=1 Tax=Siphonobacter sp. SORGH_AS_0500 TaxID=1864824 RepID=UPI000CC6AFA1|nr:hypothetical protein [Siphonobacter sp. SORGH_AS_0500]PKK37319.1 hypothetical protein BWI96_05425 [Siphonobacter sp. SORGH_AS_0500]